MLKERSKILQRLLTAFLALPDAMLHPPPCLPRAPPSAFQSLHPISAQMFLKALKPRTQVKQCLLPAFLGLPDTVCCWQQPLIYPFHFQPLFLLRPLCCLAVLSSCVSTGACAMQISYRHAWHDMSTRQAKMCCVSMMKLKSACVRLDTV